MTLLLAPAAVVFFASFAYSCNQMVCASIVSKCMLTQSCKCDMKNCTCCKECRQCLSHLYTECCSCLGKIRLANQLPGSCRSFFKVFAFAEMCPKPNETKNELSRRSHIEDLDGVPGLYNALVTDPEANDPTGFRVFTFPVDFDNVLYGNKNEKIGNFIMRKSYIAPPTV